MEDLADLRDDLYPSLPKEKWFGPLYLYQFNGCWMRPMYVEGTQKTVSNFKPLPTDVILASFPKTGTTWLKSLVYSIINRSSRDSLTLNNPHELVPFLEIQVYGPHPCLLPVAKRRIFGTHIPYHLVTESSIHSSECKVIYVTRNPKDTLISLWQFVNRSTLVDEVGTWPLETAVDKFCKGVVPYGPYHDHVLGYKTASLKRPDKIFFVTYEELQQDPRCAVKRLAEFLGCPFEKEEEVAEIVKSCSIETLKNHEVNKSTCAPIWLESPYNSFFRAGRVGDHKNYLETPMIEKIDAITRDKFHGTYSVGCLQA